MPVWIRTIIHPIHQDLTLTTLNLEVKVFTQSLEPEVPEPTPRTCTCARLDGVLVLSLGPIEVDIVGYCKSVRATYRLAYSRALGFVG